MSTKVTKISLALDIFNAKLAQRATGAFATNREFRAAVISALTQEIGVNVNTASTMYNTAKKAAEAADPTVKIGRDPKKVRVSVNGGKRGRPLGSKNRPKVPAPALDLSAVETPVQPEPAV